MPKLPQLKSAWMIVAGVLFGCMGVFVKLGAEYFSSAELVFYRSLFGLLVIYLIIKSQGMSIATPHWKAHLWRGLSGFARADAVLLFHHPLPLATAVTLNYTAPLFLAFLTVLILKESPHLPLMLAILLGFAGVVLLLRPTLHPEQLAAGLMGLASGFLAAIAYLNVKQLGQMGEPEWRDRVLFHPDLAPSAAASGWRSRLSPRFTLQNFLLLLGLGTTATLAQLAMTRAYRTGNTLVVGSLAYSTVIFASLWGILLWQEILSLGSWLGIALIILSGVLASRVAPRLPAA